MGRLLIFFSIEQVDFSTLQKIYIKSENTGYCYQIPLKITSADFKFIKDYHITKKTYSIEQKRKQHRNAYKKWTLEEDEQLEVHFCDNFSINDLCAIFGRNQGAIQSRIEKLELEKKYGR